MPYDAMVCSHYAQRMGGDPAALETVLELQEHGTCPTEERIRGYLTSRHRVYGGERRVWLLSDRAFVTLGPSPGVRHCYAPFAPNDPGRYQF